jgi:hypothetical protein
MATKAQRAAEKARVIQYARERLDSMDGIAFGPDPKVTSSPDGYWVQVWIQVPLSATVPPDVKQK